MVDNKIELLSFYDELLITSWKASKQDRERMQDADVCKIHISNYEDELISFVEGLSMLLSGINSHVIQYKQFPKDKMTTLDPQCPSDWINKWSFIYSKEISKWIIKYGKEYPSYVAYLNTNEILRRILIDINSERLT